MRCAISARAAVRKRVSSTRSCAASPRTAVCSCPTSCRASIRRPSAASRSPRSRPRCSRRSSRARASSAELGAICRDAFDFPLPLKPLARGRRARGARAVSRPDGRVQGRRRTLSRRADGARAARSRRSAARSRFSSRPRATPAAPSRRRFTAARGIRVGVLFPKGQVSPRQQHQLTCWGDNIRAFEVDGDVRRLPGAREGRVHRSRAATRHRLTRCQQHQHRPPVAAGRLSRGREPLALAAPRHGGGLDRADRQPRQRHGLRLGARDGFADARDRARREREPHDPRLSRDRPVAAAAERRDARIGDGRRQPEQHGTPAESAARLCRAAHEHRGLSRRRRERSARRSPRTIARYGEVWCPHTATAFWVYDHLPPARKAGRPWIVSATAHPAKFETIVEPVIGRAVPVPPALADLLRPADGEHAAAAAPCGACGGARIHGSKNNKLRA